MRFQVFTSFAADHSYAGIAESVDEVDVRDEFIGCCVVVHIADDGIGEQFVDGGTASDFGEPAA